MSELFNLEAEARFLRVVTDLSLADPGKARMLVEGERIAPSRLFLAAHQDVLAAQSELVRNGRPADCESVWCKVKDCSPVQTAGGRAWLIDLLVGISEAYEHAAPTYAATIRDLALRRRIVEAGRKAMAEAQEMATDPGELLNRVTGELAGLTRGSGTTKTLQEHLEGMLVELEEIEAGKRKPVIPTGIASLDALIGGLQPTVTVIGAMPGVGKSALLATMTDNLMNAGVRVGIFSLEDDARWIGWRLVADKSQVPQFVLRNRRLVGSQFDRVSAAFKTMWGPSANVFIEDKGGLTPQQIVQTSLDWIINRGCQVILIDHLGEIRYSGKRRDRFDLEIEEGLSDLREIAKKRGVPVVIAAHLRRREGLTIESDPKLTDFANSAAVERKARVALGLSRPDKDTLKVSILKQTNGAAGRACELRFEGLAAMVKDCEQQTQDDPYRDAVEEGQR